MSILGKGVFTLQIPGTLAAGADQIQFQVPTRMKLLSVYGSVVTAPLTTPVEVDIHNGGTTIFTTQTNRVIIAASAKDGAAGAVSGIELPVLAKGDVLTVDVDTVGTGTTGADLTLSFEYEGAAL